jgi:hypothetical protein
VLVTTPPKPTPIFALLESLKAMARHASVKLCAVKLAANSGKQQTGSALSAKRFGIDQAGHFPKMRLLKAARAKAQLPSLICQARD